MKSAAAVNSTTQLRRRNGHAGLAECRCPLCSSVLSPDQFSAVVKSIEAFWFTIVKLPSE